MRESIDLNKNLLASLFHITRASMTYVSVLSIRDQKEESRLQDIHREHPWYGHRRIALALCWSKKKARRLMMKFGITAVHKKRKKWIKFADHNTREMHGKEVEGIPIKNYLTSLCPIHPHVVWRSDFTHIIYHGIHLYLATVIDDCTKEIVGYALSYRHTKEFVLTAIEDAMKKSWGIVPHYFHSDQWSEYTSETVLSFLAMNHICISMSSKSSPWQNGAQESYYGKLKLELWPTKDYATMEELIVAVHRQIHYYNTKRLHTTIQDIPTRFREKLEQKMLTFTEQSKHSLNENMKESSEWKK